MLKLGETVLVKWNPMNKKFYEAKGYSYTKMGDSFVVKVEDLQPSARVKVTVVCDYCHHELEMYMYAYTRSVENRDTVACNNCKCKKSQDTIEKTYGVRNITLVPKFREKQIATLQEKYGVECPAYLPQHSEAMKTYDKTKQAQNYKKSCLERYGVDNAAKLPSSIQKAKETCVKKYGGESSQCDIEIRKKSLESMRNGGNIPSSKAERAMVELLNNIYGEANCQPQFVFDKAVFDCLLTVDGVKIDVEYDGNYWHNQKQEEDKRRDYYSMRNGIKVLRFKSDGAVPSVEQITNGVNYLVSSEHQHLIMNI